MERKYDIVILGATGFTGQFVLEEALRNITEGNNVGTRLCAAGRDITRLKATIEYAKKCAESEIDVSTEVVDVNNMESLEALTSKTKVLLSCVGPYRTYGHQVALACIKGGADYLDICGEPEFLESVQAKFDVEAKAKGLHLVGSCGFDSVPADVGTLELHKRFNGKLAHVEMVAAHQHVDGLSPPIHATTLECAVLGYANRHKLRDNRAVVMPPGLPLLPYKPAKRPMMWYHEQDKLWCFSNLGSDRSVVMRSQHLLRRLRQEDYQPLHFSAFFGMHTIGEALKALMFGFIFMILSCCALGRNLLIKYPRVLTLGLFSWRGPERRELLRQSFCVTLTGHGWTTSDTCTPPAPVCRLRVRGPDPGYFGTAIIVVQCALTMLREKTSLPLGGGVFTPAAAFANTNLVPNLTSRGVTFTYDDIKKDLQS